MTPNVVMFGWNRSVPGREMTSAQHFQEFQEYLGVQKKSGLIESFEIVFLEPHGSTLNGFCLIRGEPAKLSQLIGSPEWAQHQVRAILHLDGATSIRGFTGAAVGERMEQWIKAIPK
jgi:hypothetical protein